MNNRNRKEPEHNKKMKIRKIILLKKKTNVITHKQLRPITVLTSFYKTISKVVNMLLVEAIEKIIPDNIIAYRAKNCPQRSIHYFNDFKDLIILS